MDKIAGRVKKRTAHSKAVNKALIKTEFEGGLLTQTALCEKYGIHRGTLHRWAVAGEWEFARRREEALVEAQTALVRRMGQRRAEISEQHLHELNDLKDDLMACKNVKEASLISSKADTLLKLIRGERLSLAMPDSFKYIEQKSENIYRVEDALKDITRLKEGVIDGEFKTIEEGKESKGEGSIDSGMGQGSEKAWSSVSSGDAVLAS